MLSFAAILPGVRRVNGESVYTRVLAALRHFDWATSAEVIEAINADEREAVTARTALAAHTRNGLLEVRGPHNAKQWSLVAEAFPRTARSGRARVEKLPGECTQCRNPAVAGRRQCEGCLRRAREYAAEAKAERDLNAARRQLASAWALARRTRNAANGDCVNENLTGTHGPATHGCRCAPCDIKHKESR